MTTKNDENSEFGIELPKNKVHRALVIGGNWFGEFVSLLSCIPFIGGLVASVAKYVIYLCIVISIFLYGTVGGILGGFIGGIWYGFLTGIKMSKKLVRAILGKEEGEKPFEFKETFVEPFKERNRE